MLKANDLLIENIAYPSQDGFDGSVITSNEREDQNSQERSSIQDMFENGKLDIMIDDCNKALEDLKDARLKLELQLEESCSHQVDLQNEYPDFANVSNGDTKFQANENGEVKDSNDSLEDLEDNFTSEDNALKILTDNLEKLQNEIDEMLKNMMKDEESAMCVIDDFLNTNEG